MSANLPPAIAPDLPALLKQCARQLESGDGTAARATLDAIGGPRLTAAPTLLGALSLGGFDLACALLAHAGAKLTRDQRLAAVVAAFEQFVDAHAGASEDAETAAAEALIATFGLTTGAGDLLDTLRAEILIAGGPLETLPQAAHAAIQQSRWGLALRGFERLRQDLQGPVPRSVFGMAAICLHKLGRYAEAEQWARQGLGGQSALLEIGPTRSEAELLQRWAGYGSPVVSILCPTYNHERYIDSAIRGFLSQDCDFPFEILIHDDASTDGTQAIVRGWQARYPKLIRTVLQVENQFAKGVRPLERLLPEARGEFIATCEGDDFWIEPGKLQRQVDFLQAHPEFSCSAHNYLHYVEMTLSVRPWPGDGRDRVLSPRQLMGLSRLLWIPTLVFRKSFTAMPPERAHSPIGDQFLTSYLGTRGPCMYFGSLLAAVRRENEFSSWSPLPDAEKERIRVKVWASLVRMHTRMGHRQAVADLLAKIAGARLDDADKAALLASVPLLETSTQLAA